MMSHLVGEAPFDGISRRSVQIALDELRAASDRHAGQSKFELASRLDVVIRALEETLEDDRIEWLDV